VRGKTYEYADGYDRKILDFDQALKLMPNDPDAVYGRGRAYAQNGEYLRTLRSQGGGF
jgi:tetratricopeptide (TPR) repeat protein